MQETIMYLILSFPSIQHGQASKELKWAFIHSFIYK
jgi:hypothetical protein